MIYSTVNFVIPVKKYWIGERKGKRIESLLVQTCARFPMQLSVAKMALENSFSPITKTLVSIDRITSSRILEDDHRECNNDSKGVEIEA